MVAQWALCTTLGLGTLPDGRAWNPLLRMSDLTLNSARSATDPEPPRADVRLRVGVCVPITIAAMTQNVGDPLYFRSLPPGERV